MHFDPFGKSIFKMLGPDIQNKSILKLKRSDGILTATEIEALNLLEKVINASSFRIFTQVHLLQIFDIDKQVINNALKGSHVLEQLKQAHEDNLVDYWHKQLGFKSVDFLVCNKITTQVIFAIEIDDPSHIGLQRQQWDEIKNKIFKISKIPLLRFSNKQITDVKSDKAIEEFKKLVRKKMEESQCAIVDFYQKK
ncbi:DUF2726 domain-containing protein [Klebsiella quasivariicola]|uniref:DUF2726 domain-containing protein n=1 Tax=Klebsiella quasivariicola TaxID=2026240 RepID=UPI0018A2C215|nr:DUF2726 domain-containing protein [Klebsiella quasivariicola]MBF7818281.1 DUF2726 domain-containing protein [Klebsiella quasivariicola]